MTVASSYLGFVRNHGRLLAFGFLMTFFSSMGQTYLIALSGGAVREAFDLTVGEFGGLYSAATLASALTLPWVGRLIDRADLGRFAVAVSLGLAAACLLMASAAGPAMLLAALFALRLTGQGLMTHTAMTGLARRAGVGRGKALSIGALGFPAGEALFPPLVVLAIGALGWRGTWISLALLVAGIVPAAVRLLLSPEDRLPPAPAEGGASADGDGGHAERSWTTAAILRDPRFLAFLPALIAPGLINTGVFFHQVPLVAAKGWPISWFAAGFTVYAASSVAAAFAAGPLVDRVGALRVMPALLVPLSAGLLTLGLVDAPAAAPAFMALAGITAGINNIVTTAVWVELYGERNLGTTRSLAASVMVFSTALSPALFGILLDLGTGFSSLLLGCAVGAVAASGLSLAPVLLSRRRAG